MKGEFDIDVDEDKFGKETVFLQKEELDVEVAWKCHMPIEVRVDYCTFKNERDEWIAGAVHDVVEGVPLLLICMKNDELILIKKLDV
ncbi:hypothetical protein EH196_19395 [Bacillus sp. C1-1]|nr:hypothetical protein EH196_19395 [Bacillus sp. C1-1]